MTPALAGHLTSATISTHSPAGSQGSLSAPDATSGAAVNLLASGRDLSSEDTSSDQQSAPVSVTSAYWAETLRQLAEQNFEQIYRVLWQSLELQDPEDAEFRDFVLATLEQYGDQAPGEVLAALIQNAPSSEIRRKALELLAEASQELSVHDFNVATDDPDSLIRDSGLAFFDNLNNAALLDATAQAAQDSDDSVRMTALSTLEEMSGFTPVWEVAETLMDDADPQVRLRALELLMYGDAQTAINWLVHALDDPDPAISERAEALLAELEQGP
jgi:HEAT repeat protein